MLNSKTTFRNRKEASAHLALVPTSVQEGGRPSGRPGSLPPSAPPPLSCLDSSLICGKLEFLPPRCACEHRETCGENLSEERWRRPELHPPVRDKMEPPSVSGITSQRFGSFHQAAHAWPIFLPAASTAPPESKTGEISRASCWWRFDVCSWGRTAARSRFSLHPPRHPAPSNCLQSHRTRPLAAFISRHQSCYQFSFSA